MTVDWKKKLIPNLPYLLFVYLFDKLCQAVRLAPGLDASEKFLHLSQGFTEAFSSGLPSLHPLDLLAGIAGAVIVRLAVYAKSKNTKKYRKGIEYGSARWGTAADIAPYVDPVPDWNIPLTQTEKLTMSSRPKNPKYARNKNILVIGGSGSGKISGTAGTLTYSALLEFWSKFDPYSMNTMLVSNDVMLQMLKLSEFQNPLTGLNFQGTGTLSTPLGAKLLRTSAVPAGKLIGLDKNYALEHICGSEVMVEYDKLIDRQIERAAITSISGFAKPYQEASKVLTV